MSWQLVILMDETGVIRETTNLWIGSFQ